MVITPSIPDSPGEGVWEEETQSAMIMSPNTRSELQNRTGEYILAAL
jgi:hypothetical protein